MYHKERVKYTVGWKQWCKFWVGYARWIHHSSNSLIMNFSSVAIYEILHCCFCPALIGNFFITLITEEGSIRVFFFKLMSHFHLCQIVFNNIIITTVVFLFSLKPKILSFYLFIFSQKPAHSNQTCIMHRMIDYQLFDKVNKKPQQSMKEPTAFFSSR